MRIVLIIGGIWTTAAIIFCSLWAYARRSGRWSGCHR